MKQQLGRPVRILLDIIELYIPAAAFIVLFVSFILQIASRYVFRHPLVWPYELAQFSYLWLILLGTCFAERTEENIVFSIAYDSMGPKVKKIAEILHHLIIVMLFGLIIPSTIRFYEFYMTRHSAVFKFPLGIVYFAFAPFIVLTIARNVLKLIKDFTSFTNV